MFEFSHATVGNPFHDVQITTRIDGERVRCDKQRRIFIFIGNTFAIAEVRGQFVVGVNDRDAAGEVGNKKKFFVLVKTTWIGTSPRLRL